MKQFVVSIWLMLSIVSQSFATVVDSTIDLDITFTHLQEQHAHQIEHHSQHHNTKVKSEPVEQNDSVTEESSHNHADCHHCGHCSSPLVIFDLDKNFNLQPHKSTEHSAIHSIALSGVITNTYRPPIT